MFLIDMSEFYLIKVLVERGLGGVVVTFIKILSHTLLQAPPQTKLLRNLTPTLTPFLTETSIIILFLFL